MGDDKLMLKPKSPKSTWDS